MNRLTTDLIIGRRRYILLRNDVGVTTVVRRGDIYENHIFEHIKNNSGIHGKNVIDIGANLGAHTLEFADIVGDGKVYSFEPQQLIYYQLCGNIIINGFANVIAHNVALGNECKTVKIQNVDYFSSSPVNIGDSHIDAWVNKGYNEVTMRTLDSYQYQNVSVLKIDVQGYEPRVLDGAIDTIMRNRPIIFIEVEPPQLKIYGYEAQDVFTRLEKLGYSYRKLINTETSYDYVATATSS